MTIQRTQLAPFTQQISEDPFFDATAKQSPFVIFTQFGSILLKYGAERDLLSQELLTSGRKLMAFAVQTASGLKLNELLKITDGKDQPDPILEEKKNKLFINLIKETIDKVEDLRKILQNPYGASTLKEPWLVEGIVTWDKFTYDEYVLLSKQFDMPFCNAKPHVFAYEVLEWLKLWPRQAKNDSSLLPQPLNLSSTLPQAVLDYQHLTMYQDLIVKAKKLQQICVVNAELEKMVIYLEEFNASEFEKMKDLLAKQEKNGKIQFLELEGCLKNLREQQKKTDRLNRKANEENQKMISMLKSTVADMGNQINHLQAEIYYLSNQLMSCRQQLWDVEDKLDSSCSIQ